MLARRLRCPCGTKLKIPAVAPAKQPSSSQPKVAADTIALACSCGRKLKAPLAAQGKAVRCPCGTTLKVPAAKSTATVAKQTIPKQPVRQPAPQPVATPNDDWMSDFPEPASTAASPSFTGSGYSAPAYLSQPAASSPAASRSGGNSGAQDLLNQAQRQVEFDQQRARAMGADDDDGGFINGGVVGGALTMLIAVVWFVGGLYAGYIFFYPPILFVMGGIGVVKGLMD
ncbi:MAG: DUF1922 domain-containing protein [Pirellulaceae bacterium]